MLNTFNALTRPVRRNFFRPAWRALVGILLIALPVGLYTVMDLQGSARLQVSRDWATPTTVEYIGGQCYQDPEQRRAWCSPLSTDDKAQGDDYSNVTSAEASKALDAALPDGLTSFRTQSDFVELRTADQLYYGQLSTQSPTKLSSEMGLSAELIPGEGEVALSWSAARALGADVGSTVTARTTDSDTGATAQLRVVAISPAYESITTSSVLPSTKQSTHRLTVEGRELTWDDLVDLNTAGFLVHSQSVMDNPPPKEVVDKYVSAIPNNSDDQLPYENSIQWGDTAIGVLTAILGLVLMLVFVSPLFALNVSGHSRLFAHLAGQGATPRQLRLSALAFGAITGVLGTALGMVVATIGVRVWWGMRFNGWPFNPSWLSVAAIAAVAIGASLGASYLPAWIVSRNSIAAAMKGRSPERMVRWRRWMGVAPMLLAGFVLTVAVLNLTDVVSRANSYRDSTDTLLTLIFLVGVAGCAPALVFATSRWMSRRGPLTCRTAARALVRQSAHSIPAVAAVLCAVAGFTLAEAQGDIDRRVSNAAVEETFSPNLAVVTGPRDKDAELAAAEREFLDQVEGQTIAEFDVVGSPANSDFYSTDPTLRLDVSSPCPIGQIPSGDKDNRTGCLTPSYHGTAYLPAINGQSDALVARDKALLDMFVFSSPEKRELAADTLRRGGVLISEAMHIGSLDVGAPTQDTADGRVTKLDVDNKDKPASVSVPVAAVLPARYNGPMIMAGATADELGVTVRERAVAIQADSTPTGEDMTGPSDAIAKEHPGFAASFVHHQPYDVRAHVGAAGALALACLIVTLLAAALGYKQLRREQSLLHDLGARPGFNAKVAAWRTWLSTQAAMAAGYVLGPVGTAALERPGPRVDMAALGTPSPVVFLRPDWVLGLTCVVVPLVAAVVVWVVHAWTASRQKRTTP